MNEYNIIHQIGNTLIGSVRGSEYKIAKIFIDPICKLMGTSNRYAQVVKKLGIFEALIFDKIISLKR